MTTRCSLLLFASAVAALFVSGCGDDKPYSGPPPGGGASAQAPAPLLSQAATAPASSALAPSNPLLPKSGAADNPLLPAAGSPLTQHNPLLSGNPLNGPVMPTDHSHWLRGRVQEGRLTVRVNGIRTGEYTGVVDQDITMKLRRGINSVSFEFAPSRPGASAQMDLLESEHNPPIPPLAVFQSQPSSADAPDSAGKPVTQSVTFFAR